MRIDVVGDAWNLFVKKKQQFASDVKVASSTPINNTTLVVPWFHSLPVEVEPLIWIKIRNKQTITQRFQIKKTVLNPWKKQKLCDPVWNPDPMEGNGSFKLLGFSNPLYKPCCDQKIWQPERLLLNLAIISMAGASHIDCVYISVQHLVSRV